METKQHGTKKESLDWASLDDEDEYHVELDSRFPITGQREKEFVSLPHKPAATRPRRVIKKFGDAKDGEEGVTYVGDEVTFELTRDKKKEQEETWVSLDDKGNKIYWGASTASSQDSYSGVIQRLQNRINSQQGPDNNISEPSHYIPPGRRTEEVTLKVSNLPDTAEKEDIYELFDRFGSIQRVHMVRRRDEVIGVAYVSFARRECAAEALNRLDGHRYDHLVLTVEWAPPKKGTYA